jgi:hypothetical protein
MTRVVQIQNGTERRVALVEEPHLRLLENAPSVFALASEAIDSNVPLTELIRRKTTGDFIHYDAVYAGDSEWLLFEPIDHPEPSRCLVSGTGLTHLGSAKNRNAMHEAATAEPTAELTDSMKMFRRGVEAGRPARGKIGIPPEWFFKGTGMILRAHNEYLEVPPYAEEGGEEAEIAGVYLIDKEGHPCRIGMTPGNEFSDHRFEKKNYLNLAGSKIRNCSIGPELVIDPDFQSLPGRVEIERAGRTLWSKDIRTGEEEMCHNLSNIEHHHFKFETHRRPGDIHVHYFGAHSLSFGDGIELADGDIMSISFENFGRPLRNPLSIAKPATIPLAVRSLG